MPVASRVVVVAHNVLGVVDAPRRGIGPSGNVYGCERALEVQEPVSATVIWQVVGAHDSGVVVHAVYPCLFAAGYSDLRNSPLMINQNALDLVPAVACICGDFAGFIDCLDSTQSGEILDGAESRNLPPDNLGRTQSCKDQDKWSCTSLHL